MTRILTWSATMAAAFVVACLAMATPAFAHYACDDECVVECREEAKECAFDAREEAKECLEEAGCDELREAYREICFADDRDDDLCAEAREAYRDCVKPCREALREALRECREEFNECLWDECGIEDPGPLDGVRLRHRPRGPRLR